MIDLHIEPKVTKIPALICIKKVKKIHGSNK